MFKRLLRWICRRYAARAAKHGDLETAERLWAAAVSYGDNSPETHRKLGELYLQLGNHERAGAHWQRVRELEPGEVEAHLNLGRIHIAMGRLDAAQTCLEAALATAPAEPQVLCCLGELQGMQGELDQAIAYFERALKATPDFAPALAGMGLAMQQKGRLPEAIKWLRDAIRVDPGIINAWLTLGSVYQHLGQLETAILHQEQALALFPHHPQILSGLGACHALGGNYSLAEIYFDRALAAAPDLADARLNRALNHLRKGNYRLGFTEYEYRLQKPELQHLVDGNRSPSWQGEPLAGKKIVLRREQGFGDSIQFIRFAANLKNQGAKVYAEASPPLLRLLDSADGVTSSCDSVKNNFQADFFCPIMSLPHKLDVTLDTLPAKVPYFRLQDGDVARWKRKLEACEPLRVGIAWASNPDNWISIAKSVSLKQLLPVLDTQGISFVSLQVGYGSGQLKELPDTINIIDLTGELTDFYETACLIENLDLVIAIDSAVAHLAGALGKPTWILLHHAPDWRWLVEREDSPWYPSTRLFGQRRVGDWEDVIARVRVELMHLSQDPGYRSGTRPAEAHGSRNQVRDQTLEEAVALHQQGKLVDAERLYAAVLQTDNGNFDALHLLGTLRTQQGRWDEAAGLLTDAVKQNPASAEAHSNLGNALNEARRHEEAIASYGKAITLKADFAEAHNNLGNALNCVQRHEEAIASCRKALAIKAEFAEAHYNIGNAFYALERHDEAIASYRSALAIKPDDVEAHNNLGLALSDLNRQTEAIALFRKALALKPDFAEAHWNRGLALLTIGDLKNGWEDYEWRWRAKVAAPMPIFPRPLWLGDADPRGKTVLLHADQGFGDTIQFVRYVPMVAARGARVVLQVRSRLKELMTSLVGVDLVVSHGDPLPAFDYHCPLSSLPRAFGTRLESIPAEIPYLRASADRAAKWEALLAGHARPRIGLTWSGDHSNRKLRNRFISLARLRPLLSAPGVSFVSLQKDMSDEDARMLDGFPEITNLGDEQDNFADTAAAVSLLDLVISVDTAIVHLAGALGKPVWVLLPFTQDWRWLLEREDSPWYPSARLFRQPRMGDWDSVVERVRTELPRFSPR